MNAENLRKLARKLRRMRHEEHYDQGIWGRRTACGTAACLAGHAAVMTGWRLLFTESDGYGNPIACACATGRGSNLVVEEIDEVAKEFLDLTPVQKWRLFSSQPARHWPGEFAERWQNATERPSRIAADLLEALADGRVTL